MAGTSMSGWDARRMARRAQFAVAALGVAAGFLWGMDVTGISALPQKPVVTPPPEQPEKQAAQSKQWGPDVVDGLAARLALAGNVKPVVAPPPEPPKGGDVPPTVEPTAWTFLGPIFNGDERLALLSVDGHQKILGEGKKYGDIKLVSVARDEITIQNGAAAAQHIHKADRKPNSSVAWVRNMPSNAPVMGTGMAALAPNVAQGGMTPEMRQRLAERGISPDDMQRQRQQMRDRRNRARGSDPGGGGPGTPFQGGGPQGNFSGAPAAASATIPLNGDMTTKIVTPNGEYTTDGSTTTTVKKASGGAVN